MVRSGVAEKSSTSRWDYPVQDIPEANSLASNCLTGGVLDM
jgi:hypothetical protein